MGGSGLTGFNIDGREIIPLRGFSEANAENVVYEGDILSLKRFEDDVREVNTGQECGIQVDGFNEFEEGDEIIIYHLKQIR